MDTRLTAALKSFRERYPGCDASHQRIEGWLLDHAPAEKRAVKALAAVSKLDLPAQMAKLRGRADAFEFRRMIDALTREEGLSADLAEQAALAWLGALGIEAPDPTALRGPIDTGVLAANLDACRCLHLALVHSDLKMISQLSVESLTQRSLSDLVVSVWLSGVEVGSSLRSTTWTGAIDRLRGRQVAILDRIDPRVASQALHEVRGPAVARWWVEVKTKAEVLLRSFREVEVLPARTWPIGRVPLPSLGAFVVRDDAIVAEIVGEAAQRVEEADARAPVVKAFEALRNVMSELDLEETREGATDVRAAKTLLSEGRASALERQLLLAACLEHGGMLPLLVWAGDRAGVGLWTSADRPAVTETDDPVLLRRLVDGGALSLDMEIGSPLAALDLAAARRAGVLPLSSASLEDGRALRGAARPPEGLRQRILDRAALASARSGVLLPGAWAARLVRRDAAPVTAPRLQTWKRRLLDLTLHNPLLNLRTRTTSLPMCDGCDIAAIEDALAAGQVLRLDARPSAAHSKGSPGIEVTKDMVEGTMRAGSLLVDLPERRVATQAKNALRAFRAALDEGGVHTLFLALGTLVWLEAGKVETPHAAPLLLVPVVIRRSRQGHFEVKKADADTELNAALLEFLRREHGIEIAGVDPLPADANGVDVAAVLSAVRRAVANAPAASSWTVRETAELAILAFSGFRMWRDLDHQAADLLRHPLVKRLALGTGDAETEPFPAAETLDERWRSRDVLCPLEADGSQLAAVLAAAEGRSFVLEGPPGTGKSQTIANLVAQCLAIGKSVLFVSQKRAALEVVHARLGAIGLLPFALELYSKKASKPEFIQQLRDAADFRARKPAREWTTEADRVDAARAELNALVRALHDPRDPGASVYQTIAELELRGSGPRIEATFDPARAFERAWLADAKAALADLGPTFTRLPPGWEELDAVRATDWPKARRAAVETELEELIDCAKALEEACSGIEPWLPGLADASADDLGLADVVLESVEQSPRPKLDLLRGGDDEVTSLLDEIDTARAISARLSERWVPSLLDAALDDRAAQLRKWRSVFLLRWFILFFVRWFFRSVARGTVPDNTALLADVEDALRLQKERSSLSESAASLEGKIGRTKADDWGVATLDSATLRKHAEFARAFRKRAARFPQSLELAAEGNPAGERGDRAVRAFRDAYARLSKALSAATTTLDLAKGFAKPAAPSHLVVVPERAKKIRERTGMLREWGAYRRNRDACVALGLGSVTKGLERADIDAGSLVEAFENSWLSWWIDQRVAEDKSLAGFDGVKQRGRELRFGEMDRALMDLARQEVQARVASRKPRLDEGAPPSSQAGILLRQFNRRAGFASPRQLFSECAGLIRQLKPCVLMSPQSVAQYLDPSQPPFDIVVFDEASQVPTHEAIGAIARGRQVVVVGDSKQLPPTTFFSGQDKEDDTSDEVVTELDSILEECAASGLPSLRLEWHYRSRHPSLIAFSNSRYYGSRLQVLPAAHARAAHLGVSRVLVKGAIYDRGGTATNAAEGAAVVAEVVRRLRDPALCDRSLGVVTFSRAQQALVEDLLEDARAKHPEIDPFFDADREEPVIVKNLENIQGDERDIVLFSIGYGPDARGKMTANLGPLGQLGGERRLNVAVTRAREQLVVFVSFEPKQLDLSASASQGLHDLKAFLESAAGHGEALVGTDHLENVPSEVALKKALADRLEARGFEIDLDVGVGRYRIDLGVKHRKIEGAYVLGIELDGPRYAATDTARDRDRLRWDVLAGLGWSALLRVRALDWHEDKDRIVEDVLARIEEAEQEAHVVSTPPPPVGRSAAGPVAVAAIAEAPVELVQEASAPSLEIAYRAYQSQRRRGEFSWRQDDLPGVIADIVDFEGPISERLLLRRIADVWGLKRAPSGLAGHLAILLARMSAERRPSVRNGFFWPRRGYDDPFVAYRVPDPNDAATRRDLEDIPIEEIANASVDLVRKYGDMPREELARAIAKRFGFRGLTKLVAQRIEQGIARAEAGSTRAEAAR